MSPIPSQARRRVVAARVGHFATSNGKQPGLVPVCFVLIGDVIYHAIDAKPKSVEGRSLARVKNVEANPNAVLLVDHYAEDWRRLWYVLLRGRARIVDAGREQRRAILALRRKYAQYRGTFPLVDEALVIALDVRAASEWEASSARARRRRE